MADEQGMKIEAVPAALVEALNREAGGRATSLNDVVVAILAERFNQPHEPSGAGYTGGMDGQRMNLRLPTPLHRVVKTYAAGAGLPMRAVILSELAGALGLPVEEVRRRRPRTA